jgi:hypothetical protein
VLQPGSKKHLAEGVHTDFVAATRAHSHVSVYASDFKYGERWLNGEKMLLQLAVRQLA